MEQSAFLQACTAVLNRECHREGIGVLEEKTLHAVLKQYFSPDEKRQELRVGPYVADIVEEGEIIEIQTKGFERLRRKLHFFLQTTSVTVVYPVPVTKWIIWLDEDGTASSRRKSPKQASPCEVLFEMYKLKPLLFEPNLRFCLVMLEVEEYRLKNGWSQDGKKGASCFDRMPIALLDEIWLNSPKDYSLLVPETLPKEFTACEFGKEAGLSPKKASVAVNVLYSVHVLVRTGKRKNAYLYQRSSLTT